MKIIKRNGAEVGFDITKIIIDVAKANDCLLYASPRPRDRTSARMTSAA